MMGLTLALSTIRLYFKRKRFGFCSDGIVFKCTDNGQGYGEKVVTAVTVQSQFLSVFAFTSIWLISDHIYHICPEDPIEQSV